MIYKISDYRKSAANDDEAIELCIKDCKTQNERTIIFDGGNYTISKAILIPSDTTLILDNCTIKQADYTVDNIIRGENIVPDPENPMSYPLECLPIENIKIIGKGNSVLSGPDKNKTAFHPALGEEQPVIGDFWGWRTLSDFLSNCKIFEISGLKFIKSRCWTLSFDMCRNGYIHDLNIDTGDIKNGDGIDIRSGCHNIEISNITGRTSDDSVACTALKCSGQKQYPFKNYLYPLEPSECINNISDYARNISNIKISNVATGGKHHGIICLAANGCKGNLEREFQWKIYSYRR